MNKIFLLLSTLLVSPCVNSGNVADIFGKNVFGVSWGSDIQTAISVFPGGKQETQLGIATYTAKDGRNLFGIKRNPDNYIRYYFDANGRMNGVGIEFPAKSADNFGALLNKLTTHFGEPVASPNVAGAPSVRWPEDEGISLGLSLIPGLLSIGELLFSIEYASTPAATTREELGF